MHLPFNRARALFTACLAFALAPGAPALSAQASDAAMTADYAAFLAFIGGSPLSTAERDRLATDVARRVRADSNGTQGDDAKIRAFLSKLPSEQAWQIAGHREALRFGVESLPSDDPARSIVESHDPTIVFDPAHKRLVTQASLDAWNRACVWLAGRFAVPGPGGDFIDAQRRFVRDRFGSLPDGQQDAIAHVLRDYPMTVYAFAHVNQTKLGAAIRSEHATALDRAHFALNAADLMRQTYTATLDNQLLMAGVLQNSAAYYGMLYHRGYTSGIYR